MIKEIKESGIILVGHQDSRRLDEPLGLSVGIAYVRFFPEQDFFIKAMETELGHSNFGNPKLYTVRMREFPIEGVKEAEMIDVDIHWTRVIVVKMER